jgi:hypothetical protein
MPRWVRDASVMFVAFSAFALGLGLMMKDSEFTLRGVVLIEVSILVGVLVLAGAGHIARRTDSHD